MFKCDVLNLEWTSGPSRDRQMASLVNNYLRLNGVKVKVDSIFKGMFVLLLGRPKILMITNSTGAIENHLIVKNAKKCGFKVVTLISEGNIREETAMLKEMTWGWNKDEVLYEDIWCIWSNRSKNLILNSQKIPAEKVKVSGGVGFDSYKIIPQRSKLDFVKKWKKERYSKVIGVGCWDFGIFDSRDSRNELVESQLDASQVKRFLKDRDDFHNVLYDLIKINSDTLFILKQHPGVLLGEWASGIDGLSAFENVLVLKNEEPILDCIAVSDFWVVYESTTAMEAWLLNKKTLLLNPSGIDFPRDLVHKGSPNFTSSDDVNKVVDSFYKTGELKGFAEKIKERTQVIKDVMQWDDGLNHVRAGNAILDLLESSENNIIKLSWNDMYQALRARLRWLVKKKKYSSHLQFDVKEVDSVEKTLMKYQKGFYKKQSLDINDLRKICSE